MASLDADGDGAITREEAKSHPRLVEKFDAVDANKDGKLEKTELDAQREAHRTEWKARGEHQWKSADTDNDGKISRAEAEASAAHGQGLREPGWQHRRPADARGGARRSRARPSDREELVKFQGADKDGDRAIDLAEAQVAIPKLAEKFSSLDTDNDGKLTPEELRALASLNTSRMPGRRPENG